MNSIYVDPLMNHGWRLGPSCHLFTDPGNLDALHAFALRVGLKRIWFQDHRRMPHYDLTASRRAVAVRLGAKELSRRETVAVMDSWSPRKPILNDDSFPTQ